jgi:phosphoenolpyruvate synthase/pyruvate phosphate dikinase
LGVATSERAMAYRRCNGLPLDDIETAALVQQLVRADVSRVAFSCNPVSGSQDEIVITASWGLGASIVEGTVTPDTIRMLKSDLAIPSQDIQRKLRMTVAVPGGTQEVRLPRFLQEKRCLDEKQVQAIARMARQLEAEMGAPVDIECGTADGELYLLQCRPVTA